LSSRKFLPIVLFGGWQCTRLNAAKLNLIVGIPLGAGDVARREPIRFF
jgi:hypothetical protein